MTRCVVVSPHLDDAVLSCWARLVRPDVDEVVTVFAGVPAAGTPLPGWDRLTRACDSAERVRQRRREDEQALALAGCRPRHLDHLDCQYRHAEPDLDRLRQELSLATRDAAEVWLPAGIGAHPDHVLVRDIALEVTSGTAARALYAEVPYAVQFGWPDWVSGRAPDPHLDVDGWLAAQLCHAGFDRDGLQPRAHDLDDAQVERKRRAMWRYASQLPALLAGSGFRLDDPQTLSRELSWGLVSRGLPAEVAADVAAGVAGGTTR